MKGVTEDERMALDTLRTSYSESFKDAAQALVIQRLESLRADNERLRANYNELANRVDLFRERRSSFSGLPKPIPKEIIR